VQDNAHIHEEFRRLATDLIARVTGKPARTVRTEASDHILTKIERNAIVEGTQIAYSKTELLHLIHQHLVTAGLSRTADMVRILACLVVSLSFFFFF
jgi:predicted ATPase